MSQQQRIVYFSGNVQGVGFRFTAVRTAQPYEVAGVVRNLPDGRVEVVVEGDKDQIDRFLDDLSARMDSHIHKRQEQTAEPTGRYHDFHVAF